jgi:hypothetical protein
MKIGSLAEANAARRDLERVVRAWCDWRASEAKPAKRAPVVKKGADAKASASKKPAARTRAAKKPR